MLVRIVIVTFVIFIFIVCSNGLPPQKQHKDRRLSTHRHHKYHDVIKRDAAMTRAQKMAKVSRLRELRREVDENLRFETFQPAASIAGVRRRYAVYEQTPVVADHNKTIVNSTTDSSNTMSDSLENHFRPIDQEVPHDHLVPFQEFGKKLVAGARVKTTTINTNALEAATERPASAADVVVPAVATATAAAERRKESDDELVDEMDVGYSKPYTETNKATRPHHIMVIRQGNRRIHIANNKTATLHIGEDVVQPLLQDDDNSTLDNVADASVLNQTVVVPLPLPEEAKPNQKLSISDGLDKLTKVLLKKEDSNMTILTSTVKPVIKSNRSSTGFTLLHRTRGQIYGAKKNMTLAKLAREGVNSTAEAAWSLEVPVKNASRFTPRDSQADNTISKHSRGNATYKSSLFNSRRTPKTIKKEDMREATATTTTTGDVQSPTSKILSTAVVTSISVLGDWTPPTSDANATFVHITPRTKETIEVTFSQSQPRGTRDEVDTRKREVNATTSPHVPTAAATTRHVVELLVPVTSVPTSTKHEEILDEVQLNIRDGITTQQPTVKTKSTHGYAPLHNVYFTQPNVTVTNILASTQDSAVDQNISEAVPTVEDKVVSSKSSVVSNVMNDTLMTYPSSEHDEAMLHPVTIPSVPLEEVSDDGILSPITVKQASNGEKPDVKVTDEAILHPIAVDEVSLQPKPEVQGTDDAILHPLPVKEVSDESNLQPNPVEDEAILHPIPVEQVSDETNLQPIPVEDEAILHPIPVEQVSDDTNLQPIPVEDEAILHPIPVEQVSDDTNLQPIPVEDEAILHPIPVEDISNEAILHPVHHNATSVPVGSDDVLVTEASTHVHQFDERILHPVYENRTVFENPISENRTSHEEATSPMSDRKVAEEAATMTTTPAPQRTSNDHVRGPPPTTARPTKKAGGGDLGDKNQVVYRSEDEVQKTEEEVDNDVATYILGTFGLIPLAVAVLLAAKYFISRRKKIWESEKSPLTFVSTNEWEFPRSKLRLQTVLGQGNFGLVYKAEADDILGERATRLVAVKTIKDGASSRERDDLMRELAILKQIGAHSNVVTLFGCCTDKEPYLLIMEYVMYGKLLSFLRDNRTRKQYYNFSEETAELTAKDLTSFAYCVARGMEYLTSKGIIHRDLAARNILVDHNKICKVADFGMSRSVSEPDQIYEQAPAKGALPIRWMAPESLTYRVFTHKSDVWAFGILMWEIVTLGSTPYQTMSGREVIRQVRDGYRLERPAHCRQELYSVAATCWHHDPAKRPSFGDVKTELASLLDQAEQQTYVDLESYIESISNSRTHTTQVVNL